MPNNIGIKLTIPIPFDRPDENGIIYTKEAIERAVNYFHYCPAIYKDKRSVFTIGVANKISDISWDFDSRTCNVTIDGFIWGKPELTINKMDDNQVTDFRISCIEIGK